MKGATAKLEGMGPVAVELIQALGKSLWSEFLETKGEGLMHICLGVSDLDKELSRLQQHGGKLILGGTFQGTHWCYVRFQTAGTLLELYEEDAD